MQHKRFKRIAVMCMVLVGLGAGAAFLVNIWIDNTTAHRIYRSMQQVPKRYAAIVLGAKVYESGTPSAVLHDRLRTALDLYERGAIKKILVTGDHGGTDYDEVTSMYRWLEKRGVPPEDIFLDHAGFRTFDSMVRASKIFGVEDAVICTQAFHLPRAVFLAKRFGIDAVGAVSDRQRYRRHYINHSREFIARTVAFLDAYVWGRTPRYLGERISIRGNGTQTH